MIIAGGRAPRRLKEEAEAEKLRFALAQFWSLSRPGALLLSGWLGRRAVLLLPGAFTGALPEALLVALFVFVLFVAWERLGARLTRPADPGRTN